MEARDALVAIRQIVVRRGMVPFADLEAHLALKKRAVTHGRSLNTEAIAVLESSVRSTPVDPGPFAYAPDGSKAYIALDGGDAVTATRALQIVTVQTGVVTTKPLGSPPSGVGILPGTSQAFIAQRHPLGRVSFVELVTDGMRTVTGFDLNSHVVN